MNAYPRITSDRLATMPAGTSLMLGREIVKLTGRHSFTNNEGRTAVVVEYIDAHGTLRKFDESVFLDSATEHLDAVQCGKCGFFRHQNDCTIHSVYTYRTVRQRYFCKDKGCADAYFISNPSRQKPARRSKW